MYNQLKHDFFVLFPIGFGLEKDLGAITHSKNNVSKCTEQRHLTFARIVQNFIERVMNKIQLDYGVFVHFLCFVGSWVL